MRKMMVLMLAVGLMVCAGCSKSDDTTTEEKGGNVLVDTPLMTAASSVNERMAGLDFQELAPLARVVPLTTRSDDYSMLREFETKLSALLNVLQGEQSASNRAQGRRFTFQAFNDALQLAWDLSVMLGDEGESSSSWFGLNSTKEGEVTYTLQDGSEYLVKGTIEKEVTVEFRGFKTKFVVKKASEFFIYKNGEQVLKILSGSENNRPVWLPILIRDDFYIGQVWYRDYEINLTYDQDSTHSRSVALTYCKGDEETPLLTMSARLEDDADILKIVKHDVQVHGDFTVTTMNNLLTFVGETDNVNYLVVNGVQVAGYLEQGTTKEVCERVVASMNENLKLRLMMAGVSVGNLYLDTVYNAATGRYFPTIMVHFNMMGDQDYPITTILEMLGVEVPEFLRTVARLTAAQGAGRV